MPQKIWTNVLLRDEEAEWLRSQVAPHTLIVAPGTGSNLVSGASDADCRSSDIAFGQPAVEDVLATTDLKWIHLTSAGYTRYDRHDVFERLRTQSASLTNSSSVYDDPCAHQVLAFMLEHNRCLTTARDQQSQRLWSYEDLRKKQKVLTGQSAVIVGYGAIGRRLAEMLAPYRMEIKAFRRVVQGNESVPTFAISALPDHLGGADHVINLLPANASTSLLFDAELFARFKATAAFYNVGRGDTVNQPDLIKSLAEGVFAAAYLDVTSPEPLPPTSPLWSMPNVVITPHVAGGIQDESQRLLDHFLANFRRFQTGEPLVDLIL